MNNDYFEYKGVKYGIGTKVLVKDLCYGSSEAVFTGWKSFKSFESDRPTISRITIDDINTHIIKIIEPVYWQPPEDIPTNRGKKSNIFTRTGSGSWQSADEVTYGLIWYIVIMLIGAIFNDRWIIWTAATIIFFSWKHKK